MFDIFNTVFKYKEKLSPDKLGAYPERLHVKAMPERRYLWSSRILVIVAVFSIAFNLILTSTIYLLLPERSSAPRLFYIDHRYNQLQLLQPAEINVSVFNLVTEEQIKNYIMLRYLIGKRYDELAARWGKASPLYWMSSPSVYSNFSDGEAPQGSALQRVRHLLRNVKIDWISQISADVWQVQFQTLDYYPGRKEPDITIWRSTLRVAYRTINYPDKNYALLNPFGFLVTNYSLAYHGKPNVSEHYIEKARDTNKRRR